MIAIIVARSKNNVIGKKGKIPWKIPGEQEQFRALTTGNVVIMGRKTYEEIGHPLPDRTNIVVSRKNTFSGEELYTARSLQEALSLAGDRDCYIAGGYDLFREALPLADLLYITEIDMIVEEGDVFFPDFHQDEFHKEIGEICQGKWQYSRTVYRRKTLNNSLKTNKILWKKNNL